MKNKEAEVVINNRFQKRSITYEKLLSNSILRDIVLKVTGQQRFRVTYTDEVNKGRLVLVRYAGMTTFVSISEDKPEGRNSSVQSFPTAMIEYLTSSTKKKRLAFYFFRLIIMLRS